ncbi:MAG: Na/Pi cotransporter family protein, partial [Clostridia bacterium]|nr:Na/Pi cotransporter family protein [Clostridia bacterium]
FVGLQLLSDACSVLKTNTAFLNFFSSLNSPALYFLIGIIVTLITQSSTVTIALLISIVGTTTSFEVISLLNCAFAIYGSNIGTALTSFFMSFSGGIESKRVAFSHVVFNVLGTIFFLIFTALGFLNIFELITINSSFVIVIINVIFNVVTAIILYPFMKLLFKFCNFVINEKIKKENEIYYLKNVNLSSANIHLNQLNLCVIDLINKIEKVSKEVRAYCEDYSVTHSIEIAKKLDKLLSLNDKVKNNIIRIQGDIQGEEERLYFLQVTNKNIEWIIRNNLRIINYIKQFKDNKIYFTQKQIATFKEMYESLKIITDNVKLIVELINKDGDKKEYLKPNFEIFEASENLSNIVSKVKREMISTNIYSEKKLDRYDMFINVVNTLDNTASIFIDIGLTVTNYLTENKEA